MPTTPDIEVISIGSQLRQVNAPQALADIVTDNAFAYEIRFYFPSQVGALSGGVHQVSGSPFVTWTIQNPDASTNTYNRLQITQAPLALVQKLIPVQPGEEGVVPIGQRQVFEEVELGHLSVGDFEFGGIDLGAQAAADL